MSRLALPSLLLSVLACAPLFSQESAQPAQAEAAKKATMEGLVQNQNSKEPLKRAEVLLYRIERTGPNLMGSNNATYSAVTDAEGKFRIENLEPGEYRVETRKSGYVGPRSNSGGFNNRVKVQAGEKLGLQRYYLLPQAIVSGRVIDDEGEPVQGVSVMVLQRMYRPGAPRLLPAGQAQTNDRGEYRIISIRPGKYYVKADLVRGFPGNAAPPAVAPQPGTPVTAFVTTYYPNASEQAQATRIELAAGQELGGQDITLRKEKVVKVSGKLIDADGTPAKNVYMMVSPRDSLSFGGMASPTDNKGGFVINNLRPGDYSLLANRMDGANSQQSVLQLRVGETDMEGVTLQLQPTLEASGTFAIEGSEKKDVDFAGCTVNAIASEFSIFGSGYGMAKTDGSFKMERLAAGKTILAARCREAEASYVKSILVGGEDVYGKEIDASAIAAAGIRVVLRTDVAKINGTLDIAEEKKAALRQPTVVLLPTDERLRKVSLTIQAQVDQNNHFESNEVRPGEYLAFAFEATDYSTLADPAFFTAVQNQGTRVTVAAGESKTLERKLLPWPAEFADRLQ